MHDPNITNHFRESDPERRQAFLLRILQDFPPLPIWKEDSCDKP